MSTKHLTKARKEKNDEFYTRYEDVEKELQHYKKQLKDKIIYCNCDDYRWSNFVKFFKDKFYEYELKEIRATNYDNGDGAYYYQYDGKEEIIDKLKGNGSFDSEECLKILSDADIVVTNPPFSLFRDFVALLEKYEKKYIIVGNNNAVTYKEIFPLIKENKMCLGITSLGKFIQPDGDEIKKMSGLTKWFTNVPHAKRNQPLDLFKKYSKEHYPKYDNYDAINVDKVSEIPMDYDGVMGVPISFLDKYCPEQFEIVGHPQSGILPEGWKGITKKIVDDYYAQGNKGAIREGWINPAYYDNNGKVIVPYQRILIRRK